MLKILGNLVLFAAIAAGVAVRPARSAEQALPPQLQGLDVKEHLGQKVDLNLEFLAENGYPVPLKNYFHSGKPVILNLVYYTCPMLCNIVLNAEADVLSKLNWTIGDQFDVVTISFDPRDNFDLARKKRAAYLQSYGRPTNGWHFLVDYAGNAKKLADQVGFPYRWDEHLEQYAHPAAIFVLTPDGMLSRYLYGVRYKDRDVRLALTEAAKGKFGFTVERLLLFCYHYDPASQSYVPFATNIMRLGGVLTMLIMGIMLLVFFRRERRRATANRPAEELVTAK